MLAKFWPQKYSSKASRNLWKVLDPKSSKWYLPLKWDLQVNNSNFSTRKYQNRWQIIWWSNRNQSFLSNIGYSICGLLLSSLNRSSSLRWFSFSTNSSLVKNFPYHHLYKLWLHFCLSKSILSINLYSNKCPQFSLESYRTITWFTPFLTIRSCSKNESQYVCSFVRSL